MKLSNIVTRLCYMISLIYLCYIIFQHMNVIETNKDIEKFIDVGSGLGNLLKETALSSFSGTDYSSLMNYEWGVKKTNKDIIDTSKKDDSGVVTTSRNIINFNIVDSDINSSLKPAEIAKKEQEEIEVVTEYDIKDSKDTQTNVIKSEDIKWEQWSYDPETNSYVCKNNCYVNDKPTQVIQTPTQVIQTPTQVIQTPTSIYRQVFGGRQNYRFKNFLERERGKTHKKINNANNTQKCKNVCNNDNDCKGFVQSGKNCYTFSDTGGTTISKNFIWGDKNDRRYYVNDKEYDKYFASDNVPWKVEKNTKIQQTQ